jgi:glyoxylase-like metal-dependent hydrolase (beta-lactamase superfamily II)
VTLIADLSSVRVRRAVVSSWKNNVYLLTVTATGEQLLIDAAAEPVAIDRLLDQARTDSAAPTHLTMIVTTHAHADHIAALAAIHATCDAALLAGRADGPAIERRTGVKIDRYLDHGDQIDFGGIALEVIGLRGHTPGGIALALTLPGLPAQLFTGDSLFPGGPGRTDRPGDFDVLMTDLETKVFAQFGDDAVIWPGHGARTTLGQERPQLGQWWARRW